MAEPRPGQPMDTLARMVVVSRRQLERLQDRSELQMQLILSLEAWLVPDGHRRQPDRRS